MRGPEVGSPDWVVARLEAGRLAFERRLFSAVEGLWGQRIFLALAFVVGASLLLHADRVSELLRTYDYFSFAALGFKLPGFYVLLMAGPLLFWSEPNRTRARLPFYFLFAAAAVILWPSEYGTRLSIASGIAMSVFFPVATFFLVAQLGPRLQTLAVLASLFGAIAAINFLSDGGISGSEDRGWWVMRTERWILPISVLLAEHQARVLQFPIASRATFHYLLAPVNFIFPLPVHSADLVATDRHRQLMVKGFWDILIGLACIAATIWWVQHHRRPRPGPDAHLMMHLWHGWRVYFYFYINSFAILRIAVGVGRWCGFDLSDPYHWPLLAATPQERWRRWNTYFYNWFVAFVFIPVMRRTKSLALAVLLVFGATFLLHESADTVGLLQGEYTYRGVWFVQSRLLFFLAHAVVIYVALRTERFWPDGRSAMGWLSVAATHLLMAGVHWIIN